MLIGIKSSCSTYTQGNQLTQQGQQALLCLGGGAVNNIGSALGFINPGLSSSIQSMGQKICP
jgi:hypothetical protein